MRDVAFKLRILSWMLSEAFGEWKSSIWRLELDGNYCCDGRECGCGGQTLREMWSFVHQPKETTK